MYPRVHPALGFVLNRIPKPPFVGCQYKTTLTTTTNETLTTFNNVDIGLEHPHRIIIVCAFLGVGGAAVTVVHGAPYLQRSRSQEAQMTMHLVPTGKLVTISCSVASSLRKALSVYVAYPAKVTRDSAVDSASAGISAVLPNLKSVKNGFLVYMGTQLTTLGTFTTTWNGTDAVIEDVDAQLESASSYTAGHINFAEASNDTYDLTMTASVNGTKNLVAMTMGVPYGY